MFQNLFGNPKGAQKGGAPKAAPAGASPRRDLGPGDLSTSATLAESTRGHSPIPSSHRPVPSVRVQSRRQVPVGGLQLRRGMQVRRQLQVRLQATLITRHTLAALGYLALWYFFRKGIDDE